MRMRSIVWLTAAMTAAAATTAFAETPAPASTPPHVATITNPDWLKLPDLSELNAVWPAKALETAASGKALIECAVTAQGTLRDCNVAQEDPVGMGFGAAALLLSKSFVMKPKRIDGRPVDGGTIRIPIAFDASQTKPQRPTGKTLAIVSKVIWARAPTNADIAAVRPKLFGVNTLSGHVVVRCGFSKTGGLRACWAVAATPYNKGFEEAARRLLPKFQMAVETLVDVDPQKLFIDLPIEFPGPDAAVVEISNPEWIRTLPADRAQQVFPAKAADAKLTTGRAVLDCVADARGTMRGCQVLSEDPKDMGFGPAAVAVASVMGVNPWTEDGAPAEGRHVKFALRLNQKPDAAPPPAAH